MTILQMANQPALWEPDEEFEQLWRQVEEESHQRRTLPCKETPAETPVTRNNSETDDECWRCGEKGHRRESCNRPRVLFCSSCKKKGVRSVDCCRRPRRRSPSGTYLKTLKRAEQMSRPRRISVTHQATQCEILPSPKPPCVNCGCTGPPDHHASSRRN